MDVVKYLSILFTLILISSFSLGFYIISRDNRAQMIGENPVLNLSRGLRLIFYDGFESGSLNSWTIALWPGSIAEVSRNISYSGSHSLHVHAWYYSFKNSARIWKLINCEEQDPFKGKLLEVKIYISGLVDKPIVILGMGDGSSRELSSWNQGMIALVYVDKYLNLRLRSGPLYSDLGEDVDVGPFNEIFTSGVWHTISLIYLPRQDIVYLALDNKVLGSVSTKGLRLDGRVARIGPLGDAATNVDIYVDDVALYEFELP
jgi:hypothetical protein